MIVPTGPPVVWRRHTTTVLGSRAIQWLRPSGLRAPNRNARIEDQNMTITRRDFLGASSTVIAGLAARRTAAQETAATGGIKAPTRQAKVERLFLAPDAHPNALE